LTYLQLTSSCVQKNLHHLHVAITIAVQTEIHHHHLYSADLSPCAPYQSTPIYITETDMRLFPPPRRRMIEMKVLMRAWNVWDSGRCQNLFFANDEVLPASVTNWFVMLGFMGEPSCFTPHKDWITTTNKIYSYQSFIFYWRKNQKEL